LVLKHDPTQRLETQPYLQEFERIRYELSDTSRNENISGSTHDRIEKLRRELEVVANQAIVAGDNAAAARIYARMQYLPTIRMYDGKAIGFLHADPYSEQSWGYLVKAYQLDPNHPAIAAEYLYRLGSEEFGGIRYSPDHASDAKKEGFAAFLVKLDKLMRENRSEIWPTYYELYARWHLKSNEAVERAKMAPLLEELFEHEPKFKTRKQLLNPLLGGGG
jgi:hypothetical protein